MTDLVPLANPQLTKLPAADGDSPAPTRFAYLMLTHKTAEGVEELASRIVHLSPYSEIVVHHDLGSASMPWGGRPTGGFHLVERGPVRWGDWSMVEATLRLLRFAKDHLSVDWFVLLSGEHRPVVPLAEWEATTVRSGVDALAPMDRLPSRLRFGGADFEANQYLARSRHRWSAVPRPRSSSLHRGLGGLTKISRRALPLFAVEYAHRRESWAIGTPRRLACMRGRTLFRGSQWIAMNRRAAEAVLNVDPAVTEWFQRSWIPDETYFQTVLRQWPELVVSGEPTTFVLETPDRPTPGWMRLSLSDLPAVWDSGAPFARKVDRAARPEVLAAIDYALDTQRAALGREAIRPSG